MEVNSWRPTWYKTRFRVSEHSIDISLVTGRYMSGRSDKNQVNQENLHDCGVEKGEARHRTSKGLNLAVFKLTTVQITKLPL
jgi:hypothetical protein